MIDDMGEKATILTQHRVIDFNIRELHRRLKDLVFSDRAEVGSPPGTGAGSPNVLDEILGLQGGTLKLLDEVQQFVTEQLTNRIK